MSLRAMIRNARRTNGYRHDEEDFRIDVAPIHQTTLADLIERGRLLEEEKKREQGDEA